MIAVFYTVIVMCIRFADGSYAPGGRFFASLSPQPDLPDGGHMWNFGPQSLVLVNFIAMGFLLHYNGCKYYRELERPTATRFVHLTGGSMSIVTSVYLVVMLVGYRTFGRSCSGVILENYAADDGLALVASFAMGLSIIASA